jgi:hypothetical protein
MLTEYSHPFNGIFEIFYKINVVIKEGSVICY